MFVRDRNDAYGKYMQVFSGLKTENVRLGFCVIENQLKLDMLPPLKAHAFVYHFVYDLVVCVNDDVRIPLRIRVCIIRIRVCINVYDNVLRTCI